MIEWSLLYFPLYNPWRLCYLLRIRCGLRIIAFVLRTNQIVLFERIKIVYHIQRQPNLWNTNLLSNNQFLEAILSFLDQLGQLRFDSDQELFCVRCLAKENYQFSFCILLQFHRNWRLFYVGQIDRQFSLSWYIDFRS